MGGYLGWHDCQRLCGRPERSSVAVSLHTSEATTRRKAPFACWWLVVGASTASHPVLPSPYVQAALAAVVSRCAAALTLQKRTGRGFGPCSIQVAELGQWATAARQPSRHARREQLAAKRGAPQRPSCALCDSHGPLSAQALLGGGHGTNYKAGKITWFRILPSIQDVCLTGHGRKGKHRGKGGRGRRACCCWSRYILVIEVQLGNDRPMPQQLHLA